MICPHCNYKHGFYFDENDEYVKTEGKSGNFYELPIRVEREWLGHTQQEVLYACPKCGKTFIKV